MFTNLHFNLPHEQSLKNINQHSYPHFLLSQNKCIVFPRYKVVWVAN